MDNTTPYKIRCTMDDFDNNIPVDGPGKPEPVKNQAPTGPGLWLAMTRLRNSIPDSVVLVYGDRS